MRKRSRALLTLLCLFVLFNAQTVPSHEAAANPTQPAYPSWPLPPAKPAHDHLPSALRVLADAAQQSLKNPAQLHNLAQGAGILLNAQGVQVVVELRSGSEVSLPGMIEARQGHLLQMRVPPDQLDTLASHPQVRAVRLPARPVPSLVTTEGVGWSHAQAWQDVGFMGRGITVAVIDVGFSGYEGRLGNALPAYTVLRSFRADHGLEAGAHGVAVAEIVHSEAPGANLILVAVSSEVELGQAVEWLGTQGVQIIVHSLAWFGSGPGDGTSDIGDVVGQATSAGMLWVNAAGNMARRHYLGLYDHAEGRQYQRFADGSEAERITAQRGDSVCAVLTWEGWPATAEDYDLYLFGSSGGSAVASSRGLQDGTQRPVESLCYTADQAGDYYIAIYGYHTTHAAQLRLFSLYQDMSLPVAASSLPQPADSAQALTVGAAFWKDNTLESFSAQGPTLMGQIKPDLVGADGVSTSFGVSNGLPAEADGSGFFGTSAAAALVGGAAALYWSANPIFNLVDVRESLVAQARDLGEAGPDMQYGWGAVEMGPIPVNRFIYLPMQIAP